MVWFLREPVENRKKIEDLGHMECAHPNRLNMKLLSDLGELDMCDVGMYKFNQFQRDWDTQGYIRFKDNHSCFLWFSSHISPLFSYTNSRGGRGTKIYVYLP